MQHSLKQYITIQGVIFGLIQTILFYLLYFIDRSLLISFLVGFLFLGFVAIYPIVITVRYRNKNNGILPFKDCFKIMFFSMLLRSIVVTIFTLLLFMVIDPDLGKYLQEATIEKTVTMMEKFGTPQEQVDKTVAQMSEQDNFAIGAQVKGLLMGVVIALFYSLVIASIVKKNPPIFAPSPQPSVEPDGPTEIQN